tara:strand:- start:2726 stop:3115 length:390 start_codon:yes stop_codon:yes gene_type:complete
MDRELFKLEYIIKSSPTVLYNYLRTPSGLSEWFADNVNIKDDVFSFFWDGSEDEARLIATRDKEFVRFKWLYDEDEDEDYYFEFRIKVDSLTGETALIITDFAEPDEKDEAMLLWEKQITALKRLLGGA